MKKQRILLMVHKAFVPPDDVDGLSESQIDEFRTEHDVLQTLKRLRAEVRVVGVGDQLTELRETIDEWHPDLVFNLLTSSRGSSRTTTTSSRTSSSSGSATRAAIRAA